MNNPASLLILLFLTITFLQSGYDKLFYWKDNVGWLKGHFSASILRNHFRANYFSIGYSWFHSIACQWEP
jgi:uncharacterized membrane protein YphA (DoxX/SURF4 family)